MTNICVPSSRPLENRKADALRKVSRALGDSEAQPMLVGAFARDVWFWHLNGIETGRATEDIDISMAFQGWDVFRSFAESLKSVGFMQPEPESPEKLVDSDSGQKLDMIPFGGVSSDGRSITWHGIRTLELQLPDEVGSLSLYESSLNQATIFISSGCASTQNTPERKIYSLVTELANILMENARKAAIIEKVPAAQLLSDEKFTRHFAALFLIPAEAVQETMRQYRLTPERWNYDLMLSIKNRFGVSAQAFCYRLLELEHITESLAAEFRTRIEAHYEEVRKSATHSPTNALTHSRTNELLPFEPSPTDRATRLNAFLCDLIQLMPSGSVNEPASRAALRMLKKLGCIESKKTKV